jgi:chemotaxis protein MotA
MKRLTQLLFRLIGISMVVFGLYYSLNDNEAIAKGELLHPASLVFVTVVILGGGMASHQASRIFKIIKNIMTESPTRRESQVQYLEHRMEKMCESYYREGSSSLSKSIEGKSLPPVWRALLSQLDAKIALKDIRTLLIFDSKRYEEEMNKQVDILTTLGELSPSVGLLGTVLGLIRLLADLQDISGIGAGMSLALLTALYGIFFNILIFSPLSTRLENIRDTNMKAYEQALLWVFMVENRKPAFFCDPKYLANAS